MEEKLCKRCDQGIEKWFVTPACQNNVIKSAPSTRVLVAVGSCIETSYSVVKAHECIIKGSNNKVYGSRNIVVGDFNKLKDGYHNYFIGNSCSVDEGKCCANRVAVTPTMHAFLHETLYFKSADCIYSGEDLIRKMGFDKIAMLAELAFSPPPHKECKCNPWPDFKKIISNVKEAKPLFVKDDGSFHLDANPNRWDFMSYCDKEQCIHQTAKCYNDIIRYFLNRPPRHATVSSAIQAAYSSRDINTEAIMELFPLGYSEKTCASFPEDAEMNNPQDQVHDKAGNCEAKDLLQSLRGEEEKIEHAQQQHQESVIATATIPPFQDAWKLVPGGVAHQNLSSDEDRVIPDVEDVHEKEENFTCSMCRIYRVCIRTLDCKHACMCRGCAVLMYRTNVPVCPLCNQYIVKYQAMSL